MDFFARVTTAFWPAIAESSSTAPSRTLGLATASPSPMFRMIFSTRGIAMRFWIPSSLPSEGTTSFRYRSLSLAGAAISSWSLVLSPWSRPRRGTTDYGLRTSCSRQCRSTLLRESLGLALSVSSPADPRARVAVRVHEHHVGDVDRGLLLGDPSRDVLGRVGPHVPLDHVDALDDDAARSREDLDDLALTAAVLARDHDDLVVLLQLRMSHHSTSGASEMIFMNFFSRNSRATGPKTRVPTGSPSLEISTAALSSKRM